MTDRIPLHALDPAGAADGQSPKYDAATGRLVWAAGGESSYITRERLVAATGDKTLTLGALPVPGSPMIWVNNVIKWPTTNYTIADNEITFAAALTAGDVLLLSYESADPTPPAAVLTAPVSAYSTAIMADSPRAWWRLSEASGTLADSSGNSKTLTPVGSPVPGGAGPFAGESSVALDGSGMRLESNVGMNDSDFTIELWYKGTDASGTFAGARNSAGSSYALLTGMGNVPVGSGLDGAPFIGVTGAGVWSGVRATSVLVNDDAWHHIVFVWDGTAGSAVAASQFTIYVDGTSVPLTTVLYASTTAPLNSFGGNFRFGYNPDDTAPGALSGAISNLALYGTPLSSARVTAHYAAA